MFINSGIDCETRRTYFCSTLSNYLQWMIKVTWTSINSSQTGWYSMVLAHFTFKFRKTVVCFQYTLYAKHKRIDYLLCKCLHLSGCRQPIWIVWAFRKKTRHYKALLSIDKPICKSFNSSRKEKKNDTPFSHVHLMHFHSFHEIYQLFL